MRWLIGNKIIKQDNILMNAISNGNIELIKWYYSQSHKFDINSAWREAIQYGFLNILEWIISTFDIDLKDDIIISQMVKSAAVNGNIEILDWLCQYCDKDITDTICDIAAENEHYQILDIFI